MSLRALLMGGPEPEAAPRVPTKSPAVAVIDDVENLARVAAETAQALTSAGLGELAEPLAAAVVRLARSLQARRQPAA